MSYVIKAVLSNPRHPECGQITIPFPIPNDQYDQTIEMLQAAGLGFSDNRDCTVDEIDSWYSVLGTLKGTMVNVDQLDYLAKRLDSFCTGEDAQFQAMAYNLRLELPMPPDKIEAICSESPEDKPFKILNADSPLPGLGWHLHYTAINNNAVLAKLNQLAKIIDGMNTAGLYHLAQYLSTDYALSLDQIMGKVIHIPTSDLSGYELIPDTATDKELGNWLRVLSAGRIRVYLRGGMEIEQAVENGK